MKRLFWASLFAVSGPLAAQAQAPAEVDVGGEEDAAHAREVFQAGQTAFAEGRFEEAASLWERAYELADRPAILYNIGTAHDRAGEERLALDYYRRYLDADPDASNGAYTRSRIDVLARTSPAVSPSGGEGEAAPTPRPPPTEREERRKGPAIALFVVAGATGATGLALGLRALGLHSELQDDCPNGACIEERRGDVERMGRMALAADVLLAVSLASALGAIVALIVGAPSEDALPVEASCTGNGCGVVFHGAF